MYFWEVGPGVREGVGGGSAGGAGGSEAALAADWKRGCGGRSPLGGRAGGRAGGRSPKVVVALVQVLLKSSERIGCDKKDASWPTPKRTGNFYIDSLNNYVLHDFVLFFSLELIKYGS